MRRTPLKRSKFRIKGDATKTPMGHGRSERRSGRTSSLNGMRRQRLTTTNSEARIKQDLTTLCSLIVRMRDGYCVLCGSNRELQNGHFWHRSMPPTEFDLDNCNALCKRCNERHEYLPKEYTEWMREKLGDDGFAELSLKAHSETKATYIELWELRETFRAMFKDAKRRVA